MTMQKKSPKKKDLNQYLSKKGLRRKPWYKKRNDESCTEQQISLSRYEEGIRKRARTNITCEPQSLLASDVYLRAANNLYDYRNGRSFMHQYDLGALSRIPTHF